MTLFHAVVNLTCLLVVCHGLTQEEIDQFRSSVTITTAAGVHTISSNGLPDHETIEDDCNVVNDPLSQNYEFLVQESPTLIPDGNNLCLSMGEIGIAINGALLFNPFNVDGENAVEGSTAECFDLCKGHPEMTGRYHYHQAPLCVISDLQDELGTPILTDKVLGVALDGNPIYVSTDSNGDVIDPADGALDECNGWLRDGSYEYRVTSSYPYIMGCLRSHIDNNPPPGPQCYFACRPAAGSPAPGSGGTTQCDVTASEINEQRQHLLARLFEMLKRLLE